MGGHIYSYRSTPAHDLAVLDIVLVPTFAISAPYAAGMPFVNVVVERLSNGMFDVHGLDPITLHLFGSLYHVVKLGLKARDDLQDSISIQSSFHI